MIGVQKFTMIFQQDNAPCHKANVCQAWFTDNNVEVMKWPACSPDLNPIESVWNWIDKELLKAQYSSLAELERALHQVWCTIPRSLCVSLFESMPKRIQACIEAKGVHFDY